MRMIKLTSFGKPILLCKLPSRVEEEPLALEPFEVETALYKEGDKLVKVLEPVLVKTGKTDRLRTDESMMTIE